MKKNLLFTILFFSVSQVFGTIVYLDNTKEQDPSQKLYDNFADAYAACTNSGDTIYVAGSNEFYGTVEISKPIVIIGPGFFLSENPATQVNKKEAIFRDISFLSGSAGSILKGISNKYDPNTELYIQTDNITIENCYIRKYIGIYRSDDANISNVIISKCYFAGGSSLSEINRVSANYDGIWLNITISNNIFSKGIYAPPGSTGIIAYNFFASNFNVGTTSSFEIHNNILLATETTDITLPPVPDASITHNISAIDIFGNDYSNQEFVNGSLLFLGATNGSTDGQYQLTESSVAKSAGTGGTDIGPFGGPDPYRLSGIPNLPTIYEMSTGGFVAGDELNVHLKIKQ